MKFKISKFYLFQSPTSKEYCLFQIISTLIQNYDKRYYYNIKTISGFDYQRFFDDSIMYDQSVPYYKLEIDEQFNNFLKG